MYIYIPIVNDILNIDIDIKDIYIYLYKVSASVAHVLRNLRGLGAVGIDPGQFCTCLRFRCWWLGNLLNWCNPGILLGTCSARELLASPSSICGPGHVKPPGGAISG